MFKKIILIWMLIFSSLLSSGDDFITTTPRKEKAYLDIEVTKVKSENIIDFDIDYQNKIITLKNKTLNDNETIILTENEDLFGSLFSVNGRIDSLKKISRETNLSYLNEKSDQQNILISYKNLPQNFYIGIWNKEKKNLNKIYSLNLTNLSNLSTDNSEKIEVIYHEGPLQIIKPINQNYDYIPVEIGTIKIINAKPPNGDTSKYRFKFNRNLTRLETSWELNNLECPVILDSIIGDYHIVNGEYVVLRNDSFYAKIVLKIPKSIIESPKANGQNFWIKVKHPHDLFFESQPNFPSYSINPPIINVSTDVFVNKFLKNPTIELASLPSSGNIQIELGDIWVQNASAFSRMEFGSNSINITLEHFPDKENILNVQGYIKALDSSNEPIGNKVFALEKQHGEINKARFWIEIPVSQLKNLNEGYLNFNNNGYAIIKISNNNGGAHPTIIDRVYFNPIQIIQGSSPVYSIEIPDIPPLDFGELQREEYKEIFTDFKINIYKDGIITTDPFSFNVFLKEYIIQLVHKNDSSKELETTLSIIGDGLNRKISSSINVPSTAEVGNYEGTATLTVEIK